MRFEKANGGGRGNKGSRVWRKKMKKESNIHEKGKDLKKGLLRSVGDNLKQARETLRKERTQ